MLSCGDSLADRRPSSRAHRRGRLGAPSWLSPSAERSVLLGLLRTVGHRSCLGLRSPQDPRSFLPDNHELCRRHLSRPPALAGSFDLKTQRLARRSGTDDGRQVVPGAAVHTDTNRSWQLLDGRVRRNRHSREGVLPRTVELTRSAPRQPYPWHGGPSRERAGQAWRTTYRGQRLRDPAACRGT